MKKQTASGSAFNIAGQGRENETNDWITGSINRQSEVAGGERYNQRRFSKFEQYN